MTDRIGGGSSRVAWTVIGTAGGEQFSLSRNNRFADPFDVAFASTFELLDQLTAIADNQFADVTFKDLSIDAAVDPAFQRYRIAGLERHDGTQWVRVDPARPLTAAPGSALQVRVLLADTAAARRSCHSR